MTKDEIAKLPTPETDVRREYPFNPNYAPADCVEGYDALVDSHAALEQRLAAAVMEVERGRGWTMRIPARPDMDSDLLINNALRAARDALKERAAPEGRKE